MLPSNDEKEIILSTLLDNTMYGACLLEKYWEKPDVYNFEVTSHRSKLCPGEKYTCKKNHPKLHTS